MRAAEALKAEKKRERHDAKAKRKAAKEAAAEAARARSYQLAMHRSARSRSCSHSEDIPDGWSDSDDDMRRKRNKPAHHHGGDSGGGHKRDREPSAFVEDKKQRKVSFSRSSLSIMRRSYGNLRDAYDTFMSGRRKDADQ